MDIERGASWLPFCLLSKLKLSIYSVEIVAFVISLMVSKGKFGDFIGVLIGGRLSWVLPSALNEIRSIGTKCARYNWFVILDVLELRREKWRLTRKISRITVNHPSLSFLGVLDAVKILIRK